MRLVYDSVTAADIPTTAAMVAGYIDGRFKWSAQDWARFPNAIKIPIACFAATDAGIVGDVERGDMMPWELPDWVLRRRAAGVIPTGYVNYSNWGPTRTEFQLRGILEPFWWVASYDGKMVLPANAVAKQYADSALTGHHYDQSIAADYWPGVDVRMTEDQIIALGHVMHLLCYGQPMDAPAQESFVAAWRAGTAIGDIFAGWYGDGTAQHRAYPKALTTFKATITPE